MADHDRWKCRECDHICTGAEMLTAPNPFADTAEVHGCPKCRAVESLSAACAIEGCGRDGTCGGPGSDGVYRTTCYEHADWLHKKAAAGVASGSTVADGGEQ
jgi:hypothetical protein